MRAVKHMFRAIALAKGGAKAARQYHKLKRQAQTQFHIKKEDEIIMKKSTFAAILAFIAAAAGALMAAWLYIRRREKELDEYEQLLFSEDFNDEIEEDEEAEVEAEPQAEAPKPPEPSAE